MKDDPAPTFSFEATLPDPETLKVSPPDEHQHEKYYPDSEVAENLFSTHLRDTKATNPLVSSEDYHYGDHLHNSLCLFRCLGNVLLGGPEKLMLIRAFLSFFMKCLSHLRKDHFTQLFPSKEITPSPVDNWAPLLTSFLQIIDSASTSITNIVGSRIKNTVSCLALMPMDKQENKFSWKYIKITRNSSIGNGVKFASG